MLAFGVHCYRVIFGIYVVLVNLLSNADTSYQSVWGELTFTTLAAIRVLVVIVSTEYLLRKVGGWIPNQLFFHSAQENFYKTLFWLGAGSGSNTGESILFKKLIITGRNNTRLPNINSKSRKNVFKKLWFWSNLAWGVPFPTKAISTWC